MTLNKLKDILFDVLNESDELNLQDIQADEQNNRFSLCTADGAWFELTCRERDISAATEKH